MILSRFFVPGIRIDARSTRSACGRRLSVLSLAAALAAIFCLAVDGVRAESIRPATYDVDSYMFIGLNTSTERGLTLTTDFSEGVVAANNSHFIFAVVKFDDLSSLATKAAGGGDKFLRLSTDTFPGPATIGVSVAQADIEANDATGYPSLLFLGNRNGLNVDRLRWYMNNIKGDDPAYGGYAGGAPHVGTIDIAAAGTYEIDVTAAVDDWIVGSQPNYGFGLWGIDVSGEQGNTFDLASSENPNGNGPVLVISDASGGPMPGDTDGNGVVDRADLARLVANFGRDGAAWSDGDFDGDGLVALADLAALQAHLQHAGAATQTAIPEPSGVLLSLLGIAATVAASRFRRVGGSGIRA